MHIAIDKFGRVVIPKSMREHLGFLPGSELILEEYEDKIVLQKVDHRAPVINKKGVLVFTGQATADIESAVHQLRQARLDQLSD